MRWKIISKIVNKPKREGNKTMTNTNDKRFAVKGTTVVVSLVGRNYNTLFGDMVMAGNWTVKQGPDYTVWKGGRNDVPYAVNMLTKAGFEMVQDWRDASEKDNETVS